MKILFVGLPGSGKTTLSKYFRGIDTDDILSKDYNDLQEFIKNNCDNVEDFFLKEGLVVRKTLEETTSKFIASGGSVVHDPKTNEYITNNENIYVIWLKMTNENKKRGFLNKNERGVVFPDGIKSIDELIDFRNPLYEKLSNLIIRTDVLSFDETVDIIEQKLAILV